MIGMGSLDLSSFLKHTTKYTLCPNYFSNKFNIVTVAKNRKKQSTKTYAFPLRTGFVGPLPI